jgi:hypothetical protein
MHQPTDGLFALSVLIHYDTVLKDIHALMGHFFVISFGEHQIPQ